VTQAAGNAKTGNNKVRTRTRPSISASRVYRQIFYNNGSPPGELREARNRLSQRLICAKRPIRNPPTFSERLGEPEESVEHESSTAAYVGLLDG
jgi:hypothetical protein